MEIDPEVQALLDDLPPVKLPEALVEQGWGQVSMDYSIGGTRKAISTEVAPTFEPCVQCGRPVAQTRQGRWMDHAGNRECDGALMDSGADMYSGDHVIQANVEMARLRKKDYQEYDRLLYGPSPSALRQRADPVGIKPPPIKTGPCGHNKGGRTCHHLCNHPSGHFGMHECKTCRHLWL